MEHSLSSHSQKRRRLSDDYEPRERPLQRLRAEPQLQSSQSLQASPVATTSRRPSGLIDQWACTTVNTSQPPRPVMSSPSMAARIIEANRPTLLNLPSLTFGGTAPPPSRPNGWSGYAPENQGTGVHPYPQRTVTSFDPPGPNVTGPIIYGYHQPRLQHHAVHPAYHLPHERTPFTMNHTNYGNHYPYGMNLGDMNDNKQGKRRGNLPKETTDKLRAWFVNHLQHPYPTEDEKQDLMVRTGLQMSKCDANGKMRRT